MYDLSNIPASFRGPLIRPGDEGYNEARLRLFNVANDSKPSIIARPLDASDVSHIVRYARASGLGIAIRGGGHDLDGRSMADGALVIDFTLMRDVSVDPQRRVARGQAGVLLGELDRATAGHGMATVSGTVSNTGIAGLTLGGGIGWLMRRFGTTVDNVIAFDVVSVDGEQLRADEQTHADLYWAMRGGGGNFAVVSAIEYRLYPLESPMLGGRLVYSLEDGAQVLASWRDLMMSAPRELASTAVIGTLPAAPFIPEGRRGQPGIMILVCHSGALDAAARDLQPLRERRRPILDDVRPMSYLEIQSMSDTVGIHGYCAYELGGYLRPDIDDGLLEGLVSCAAEPPRRGSAVDSSVVMITRMGGAVDEFAEESVAFAREGAGWYWNTVVQWALATQEEPMRGWAHSVQAAMQPCHLERCYINLTVDQGPDWLRRAYGDRKFRRLQQIKTAWDPTNVLRHNKNIPPLAASEAQTDAALP